MQDNQPSPILRAIDISKSYGRRRALDRVTLAASRGEVVGLLGPNGAGKTTTLSILSSLMPPDSGRVLLAGQAPGSDPRTRRVLGWVPQSLALYPALTAAQNLWHFARMQGLTRSESREACARVLKQVGLFDRAGDVMLSFSGGMKRRLNLACGIVHGPQVLLLDEPTVGVDVQSREEILRLVRAFADAGAAVIYSTHYMEEAERICDRVLLIDSGSVVAEGTVENLIQLAGARTRMEMTYRGELPGGWRDGMPGVREIPERAGEGSVALELASTAEISHVLQRVRDLGVNLIDFSLHSPNLADAFIALTGRALRDD